jgi:hypothetical protein
MVVPVAVPPLIEVQSFMRISLMIGIGGAGTAAHGSTTTSTSFLPRDDGFGPRMEFLSSPWDREDERHPQADRARPTTVLVVEFGSRFVDCAGNGALLRFGDRTVAHRGVLRWSSGGRSACYCGCLAHPYGLSSSTHRDPPSSIRES